MNYLKSGLQNSDVDRNMEMARPLTPRSERPRHSYGSMEMSLQTSPGLCGANRKCVRREGHMGACWPDSEGR